MFMVSNLLTKSQNLQLKSSQIIQLYIFPENIKTLKDTIQIL